MKKIKIELTERELKTIHKAVFAEQQNPASIESGEYTKRDLDST
jgi:hypothetical protein